MATFPERALAWVNAALVMAIDAVMAPLLVLPSLFSLLLLALLTAAGIVAVMARTSNQGRLRHTKRQIQAALFEIRLFNDDPSAVMRSLGDALRHNATYLRWSSVPLAIVSVPLLLLVAHLDAFYGYTGLEPGTPALIAVERNASDHPRPQAPISLETPEAIDVGTGPVQLVGTDAVLWRILPVARGDFIVTIRVGEDTVRKTVRVSGTAGRRSRARVQPGMLNQLLHPSEPPLDPRGPLSAVTIGYPEASVDVLGVRMHWLLIYFVSTMGWALLIARRLRVVV